jgi:hypothetical protein
MKEMDAQEATLPVIKQSASPEELARTLGRKPKGEVH